MKGKEIRQRFIDYFVERGHLHLPSSSLVPRDDPTLLFTNAGMVQFKEVFLGEREPPAPRAVTAQKCLRVSGKHNDLEEVGVTARHHTFFEMLGNFSFGDYFKEEAIAFGWEFVTGNLGLEPDRLWATVHRNDDDARTIWLETSGLPPERVLGLGDAENFWQMGDTGPCGPCSEIHYDFHPGGASETLSPEAFIAAGEADRFMEIWNLVFMQFDRGPDGADRPLPAPSIDTGAGLERIAAILQGARTNYHTDLFLPLIREAEELLEATYSTELEEWEAGLPFRVLADHARAVAFLLADGVFPSNEGRGYVLRRILRRAGRHAWLMGRREPVLDRLVDRVVDMMGDVYPELAARREHLVSTTRAEEERFLSTIDDGMRRFDEIAPAVRSVGAVGGGAAGAGAEEEEPGVEGAGGDPGARAGTPAGDGGPTRDGTPAGVISGEEAFRLYDTYGFPLDLTQLMAAERGYEVDVEGFQAALEKQRVRSREDRAAAGGNARDAEELVRLTAEGEQEFVGYDRLRVETTVLAAVRRDGRAGLLLARNPFYAEAGGQVSDTGRIRGEDWELRVESVALNERGQTVVAGPLVRGELPEPPDAGELGIVTAEVETRHRRDTERNHTATHLLHAALRAELGEHVQQAGSLVAPDRLRFDFSHRGPLTREERRAVERRVNEAILANHPIQAEHRDYRSALEEGAMALFGEKYGDVVRCIEVPGVSLELCGGTHVRSTGQIGLFKIVSETGVAAGIRRVEAITGHRAYERVLENEDLVAALSERLRVPTGELPARLDRLLDEREELLAAVGGRREEIAVRAVAELLEAGGEPEDGVRVVVGADVVLPAGADLAQFGDLLRDRLGSGAAIVHVTVPEEEREAFLSVVTDDWIQRGIRAGDLVKVASGATGSGGGGRPHLAQGGVGDRSRVAEALEAAREQATGAMRTGAG